MSAGIDTEVMSWFRQAKTLSHDQLRKIDVEVAKVLGYTVYHYDKDVKEHCYYMLMDAEFVPVNFIDGSRKTEVDAWNDVPRFTEDIAAAWQLIDRLRAKGWLYGIGDIGADVHECTFYLDGFGPRIGEGSTAAEAIVAAFLAAASAGAGRGHDAT